MGKKAVKSTKKKKAPVKVKKTQTEDPATPKCNCGDPKNPTSKLKVVIDPGHGHGSKNVGASVVTGLTKAGNPKWDSTRTERQLVLKVGQALMQKLIEKGYDVSLTRDGDDYPFKGGKSSDISDRSAYSTMMCANYFISLHGDGANDNTVSGAHAIYRTDENKDLAEDIYSDYTVVTKDKRHPNKRTDLGVLGSNNKADFKVLLEMGFVSNPTEYDTMNASTDKMATEFTSGLQKHIDKHWDLTGPCPKKK